MPAPSIHERARQRVCPNCGKPSPERRSPRSPAPLYCRPEDGRDCKREMNNRNLTDGAALIPYLKAWRADRGSGPTAKSAFARICRIVDDLNDQDRKAARPHPRYYAGVLMESNAPPVDELRYGRRKIAQTRKQLAAEQDQLPLTEAALAPEPTPEPEPENRLEAILRQIANGHNDPRALAEQALGLR